MKKTEKNKKEIPTGQLTEILEKASLDNIDDVLAKNKNFMVTPQYDFYNFFKDKLKEKKLKAKDVFYDADISERYGYKILSGEKIVKYRDIIIRMCYAAKFDIDDTQKALKLYGHSPLYAKIKRDALIIVAINTRPGDIFDVNDLLVMKGEKPLKTNQKD